jgi:hypothetical protein
MFEGHDARPLSSALASKVHSEQVRSTMSARSEPFSLKIAMLHSRTGPTLVARPTERPF